MLERQITLPRDEQHWLELRSKDITSTEISALFDLSPYMTEFELFHRKKDNTVIDMSDNERVRWGRRLEDAIAFGVIEDHGLEARKCKEYFSLPSLRIGSSFDYMIKDGGILEIKNIDSLAFKEKWIVERGTVIEAPPHIELQVQHQMFVSGANYCIIAALVGGNKLTLLKREPDEFIAREIQKRATEFWNKKSILPRFPLDTRRVIALNGSSRQDISYTGDYAGLRELARAYKESCDQERKATEGKETLKAKIFQEMGQAENAHGEDFTISAKMTKSAKPYRMLKVILEGEQNE